MEDQREYFESPLPHFFKIVLRETIQSGKLVLPKRFVRLYGKELCKDDKVCIKVPSGDVWEVRLHRQEGGGLCLHEGWSDFVELYGIKFGQFLLFTYYGGSQFRAVIFDKSTSEIKYPIKSSARYRENVKPLIKVEQHDVDGDDDVLEDNEGVDSTRYLNQLKPRKGNAIAFSGPGAIDFHCSNPHFRAVIQPSYLLTNEGLHVPKEFSMRYIKRKKCPVRLFISCGRFWSAEFAIRKSGHNKTRTKIRGFGWNKFVKDNRLVAGDICVFELVKASFEVHFQVTTFKPGEDVNLCDFPGAKGLLSKYPSFKLTIIRRYLKWKYAPLGSKFLRHLKRQREQVVALEVDGRVWLVKAISCRGDTAGILSCGWSKFASENTLQVGDKCVFELSTERDDMVVKVVKVTIHRSRAVK